MKILLCVSAFFVGAIAATSGRIVGGADATRGQFPHAVSLQFSFSGIRQHACGGSILSPSWIITAADCLTEVPVLGAYSILAGVLDLNDTNEERQLVSMAYSLIHPQYQGGASPHDIALIRTSSSLVFNEQVQPIRLPSPNIEFDGPVTLTGWGSIAGTSVPIMPNRLQTIEVPIVPIQDCQSALDTLLGGAEHPLDQVANICSGPISGGISACSGDSGSALLKGDVLAGIFSWGILPCGIAGAPSVHTRVSNYIPWILSTVNEPLLLS